MTRTDVDTIISIAREELAVISNKTLEKHEVINESAAEQKRRLIINTAKKLFKTGLQPSLISQTLVKGLTDRSKGMSVATIRRALQSPEYQQFKDQKKVDNAKSGKGKSGRKSKSSNQMIANTNDAEHVIAVAVSTSGSTLTTTPTPEPESENKQESQPNQPESESKSQPKTKWPEQDVIAAINISGDRNKLINSILDDLSGVEEIERVQTIRESKNGANRALVERCKDHIFNLALKVPDLQLQISLSLAQQLLSLVEEYEMRLHDRFIQVKSRIDMR